jgi:hypothetical protein
VGVCAVRGIQIQGILALVLPIVGLAEGDVKNAGLLFL